MDTFKGIMDSKVVRIIAVAVVALAVLVFIFGIASGCSSSKNSTGYNNNPNPTPGSNDVSISGMAFNPSAKTVTVGTTITWTNHDNVAHTVTAGVPGSPSGAFSSGNIPPNGTFSHTFSNAGSFPYFCSIHTSMTATITVQ